MKRLKKDWTRRYETANFSGFQAKVHSARKRLVTAKLPQL